MTSRISVCLAEGPTVGVSVSSTSYLQDIKIGREAEAPTTEHLQQRDCNGVVNILTVHLLMNHWLTLGYHVDHSCADNVDGAGGIDMADVQLLVAYVFDPAGHSLNCPT